MVAFSQKSYEWLNKGKIKKVRSRLSSTDILQRLDVFLDPDLNRTPSTFTYE